MKYFPVTIIVAAFLFSCNRGQNQLAFLEKADAATIQFFKPKDTLTRGTKDAGQISVLAETVMDGAGEPVTLQDTTGRMLFTQKDSVLLEIYFSTPNTGSKFGSPVFVIAGHNNRGGGRFTYKAGMLLGDMYNYFQANRKKQ